MSSRPLFDMDEIRRALGVLCCTDGGVHELRALETRKGTVSGYFDNREAMAKAAAAWSGKAEGVYLTLNPVQPDLLARAVNRAKEFSKHTSSDPDVTRRLWLPVDADAKRASGISSTDEEHELAVAKAKEIRQALTASGWPAPILADSGNGAHLLYRIDLPNDDASRDMVSRFLRALAWLYNDDRVQIDEKTFNAARLWKLYGTLAAKGDSTSTRPHRIARLIEVPEALKPATVELIETVAILAPELKAPQQRRPGGGNVPAEPFDADRWIAEHNLDVYPPVSWNGGRRWIFRVCPWNPDHTDRSAYILQFPSGAMAAGCQHNSCTGRDWFALRDTVEPGWRDRKPAPPSPPPDYLPPPEHPAPSDDPFSGPAEPATSAPATEEKKKRGRPTKEEEEAWLTRALGGCEGADRMKAARKLAGQSLRDGKPIAQVKAYLLAWNGNNRPPLTDQEIDSVISWVADKDAEARWGAQNFSIEKVEKHLSQPPLYYVYVFGVAVQMSIDDLMNYGNFKKRVAEYANEVPLMKKPSENWPPYVNEILTSRRVDVAADEDAGEEGMLWWYVRDYLQKKNSQAEDTLSKGGVYRADGLIYFNGPLLHKKLGIDGIKVEARKLWDVIRKHGGKSDAKKVKTDDGGIVSVRCWRVPETEVITVKEPAEAPDSAPAPEEEDDGEAIM